MTLDKGIDFETKVIDIEGTSVKVRIWDTAGQERFRSIPIQYFHRTNGFAIVFSAENARSFELMNGWLKQIKDNCAADTPIIIMGNKYDISPDRVEVSYEDANEFAVKNSFQIFRVSAKTGKNVDDAFEYLCNTVYDKTFKRKTGMEESFADLKSTRLQRNTPAPGPGAEQKKKCCT